MIYFYREDVREKLKKIKVIKIFILPLLLCSLGLLLKGTFSVRMQETESAETKEIGKLEVHFLDVGQGDATLIMQEGHTMLVDGGDNLHAWQLVSDLTYLGVEHLDYIVATHPDMDHIGGLDVVLEHFSCDTVLMPQCEKDTYSYHEFLTAIKDKNVNSVIPKVGAVYTLGTAEFTILAPSESYEEINNNSIVFRLTHGNKSFLFTGDAQRESEMAMIRDENWLKSDVYKVAHHGSRSSNTELFLLTVRPSYAVISCGEDNEHGHPHSGVLNILRLMGVKVFRTDEQGTIVAVSDGSKITFNMSPSESWQAGN